MNKCNFKFETYIATRKGEKRFTLNFNLAALNYFRGVNFLAASSATLTQYFRLLLHDTSYYNINSVSLLWVYSFIDFHHRMRWSADSHGRQCHRASCRLEHNPQQSSAARFLSYRISRCSICILFILLPW